MLTDPRPPAERLAGAIDWLIKEIARRCDWRLGPRQLPAPVILLIAMRLQRLANRFAAIVARLEAGTLQPPGAARPRPASTRPPGPRRPPAWLPKDAPVHLLRRKAWVVRAVGIEAGRGASYLRDLLADPAMVALIAAAPQTGRVLRPLCRMLGVELPPLLGLPPRPPRQRPPPQPKPPAPALPPLPPLHPRWWPPARLRRTPEFSA